MRRDALTIQVRRFERALDARAAEDVDGVGVRQRIGFDDKTTGPGACGDSEEERADDEGQPAFEGRRQGRSGAGAAV